MKIAARLIAKLTTGEYSPISSQPDISDACADSAAAQAKKARRCHPASCKNN